MSQETMNASQAPCNLTEALTGDLPEDCFLGGEYLPVDFPVLPIDRLIAVTQAAMLDNQDFHQEIAYAAVGALLSRKPSVEEVSALFFATGRLRDALLSKLVCQND